MPLNLTDMRRTEQERRDVLDHDVTDVPSYPWGLQLNLDDEELSKLGFTGENLEPEAKVQIMALGQVTLVETVIVDGQKKRRATVQIQNMALTPLTERASPADVIYGDKK